MGTERDQLPSRRELYDVIHGQVLLRQRKRLGLSRSDLAERLRETRSADYVSKVERGDRPADRVRDEMAERLGFDPIALARLVHAAVDEVEVRPMKKVYDVPDGEGGFTWRWTRDPAPMRLTLVNGEMTFVDGEATAARPGEMVRPG